MSAQDTTERVLRNIHVLISKGEIYEFDEDKIIIDREKMVGLLKELNAAIYAMMEEYEMTKESRDQAEREVRKHADEIVNDANRKAEDIYAASVMYTDEALGNIQGIMSKAEESVKKIYKEMEKSLAEERYLVRANQTELKSQLQDLADTEKYLMLITDRNREIQKEKEKEQRLQRRKEGQNIYADRKTGIRVDKEAIRRLGLQTQEEADTDMGAEHGADDYAGRQSEVRVDQERLKKLGLQQEAEPDEQTAPTGRRGGTSGRTGSGTSERSSGGTTERSGGGTSDRTGGNTSGGSGSGTSGRTGGRASGQTAAKRRSARRTPAVSVSDEPITPMDLAGAEERETEPNPAEDELIRLDLDADYFKWKDEQDEAMNAAAEREKASRRRKK